MLTNPQKRYLKGLANTQSAWFQIGKEGIKPAQLNSISDALLAHELVKIKLLKSCELALNAAAIEVARQTHSEIVQLIGRTMILYRASPARKISLPR